VTELRAHGQCVAEQLSQAAHDRESQSDALGSIALRVAELIELLEHVLLLVPRNATARVPHLDAQITSPAPAADHDAAAVRIRDGIRDDVAQDAFQQHCITHHE
jgi:hypothetical protein